MSNRQFLSRLTTSAAVTPQKPVSPRQKNIPIALEASHIASPLYVVPEEQQQQGGSLSTPPGSTAGTAAAAAATLASSPGRVPHTLPPSPAAPHTAASTTATTSNNSSTVAATAGLVEARAPFSAPATPAAAAAVATTTVTTATTSNNSSRHLGSDGATTSATVTGSDALPEGVSRSVRLDTSEGSCTTQTTGSSATSSGSSRASEGCHRRIPTSHLDQASGATTSHPKTLLLKESCALNDTDIDPVRRSVTLPTTLQTGGSRAEQTTTYEWNLRVLEETNQLISQRAQRERRLQGSTDQCSCTEDGDGFASCCVHSCSCSACCGNSEMGSNAPPRIGNVKKACACGVGGSDSALSCSCCGGSCCGGDSGCRCCHAASSSALYSSSSSFSSFPSRSSSSSLCSCSSCAAARSSSRREKTVYTQRRGPVPGVPLGSNPFLMFSELPCPTLLHLNFPRNQRIPDENAKVACEEMNAEQQQEPADALAPHDALHSGTAAPQGVSEGAADTSLERRLQHINTMFEQQQQEEEEAQRRRDEEEAENAERERRLAAAEAAALSAMQLQNGSSARTSHPTQSKSTSTDEDGMVSLYFDASARDAHTRGIITSLRVSLLCMEEERGREELTRREATDRETCSQKMTEQTTSLSLTTTAAPDDADTHELPTHDAETEPIDDFESVFMPREEHEKTIQALNAAHEAEKALLATETKQLTEALNAQVSRLQGTNAAAELESSLLRLQLQEAEQRQGHLNDEQQSFHQQLLRDFYYYLARVQQSDLAREREGAAASLRDYQALQQHARALDAVMTEETIGRLQLESKESAKRSVIESNVYYDKGKIKVNEKKNVIAELQQEIKTLRSEAHALEGEIHKRDLQVEQLTKKLREALLLPTTTIVTSPPMGAFGMGDAGGDNAQATADSATASAAVAVSSASRRATGWGSAFGDPDDIPIHRRFARAHLEALKVTRAQRQTV